MWTFLKRAIENAAFGSCEVGELTFTTLTKALP